MRAPRHLKSSPLHVFAITSNVIFGGATINFDWQSLSTSGMHSETKVQTQWPTKLSSSIPMLDDIYFWMFLPVPLVLSLL